MEEEKIDITKPLEDAHKALLENKQALSYIQSRGLSIDTIKKYRIGYAAGGHNEILKDYKDNQAKSRKAHLYKYIFPYIEDNTDKLTYFMSEIVDRKQIDDYNSKYRKLNGLTAPIFNERYIKAGADAPEVVYITEGVYDALSVEEVGGRALAVSGTAHRRFLELCKKYKPNTTFIISLDNDKAGVAASDKIKDGLDSLDIGYIVKTAASGKDFNESLQSDRKNFEEFIRQTTPEAAAAARELEEQEKEAYIQCAAAASYLSDFLKSIEASKTATYYSTGIKELDKILDGGLYAGLYFVGAISSLGKTTFCLQIADNIAAAGQDVLIFSLEMARKELIAKSVSRHSLLEDVKQNNDTKSAKTTRGILTGSRYKDYNKTERKIIEDALISYSKYANNIYIHEGIGDIGVEEVRETVERHIRLTGNKPLVLIDYVQILAPHNERASDKQNTDKAVLELKRLSRDYDIVIIGISSFNRDNYTQPVSMGSFKESGAIEYGSDCLIGLQYFGMDYDESEGEKDRLKRVRGIFKDVIKESKQGEPIDVQVKVLKARNGLKGDTVLKFYPKFNYFTDTKEIEKVRPDTHEFISIEQYTQQNINKM